MKADTNLTTSHILCVTMQNDSRKTIVQNDITDNDILCGRGTISYFHSANRRFRFLTALNMERYTEADGSRRIKSLFIQSLYEQIREAGGRFLIKRNSSFVQVSEKVAREKISHSFKCKKLPLSQRFKVAKTKLLKQAWSSNRFGDNFFIAANARLLRVDLPKGAPNASDNRVENLLTEELESMYNLEAEPREDKTLDEKTLLPELSHVFPQYRGPPLHHFFRQPSASFEYSVLDSSSENPFDRALNNTRLLCAAHNKSIGAEAIQSFEEQSMIFPESNIVPFSFSDWAASSRGLQELDVADSDFESDDTDYTLDLLGDDFPLNESEILELSNGLPHTFSDDHCQDLMGLLDVLPKNAL